MYKLSGKQIQMIEIVVEICDFFNKDILRTIETSTNLSVSTKLIKKDGKTYQIDIQRESWPVPKYRFISLSLKGEKNDIHYCPFNVVYFSSKEEVDSFLEENILLLLYKASKLLSTKMEEISHIEERVIALKQ
jgi:hypothetical protein